MTAAQEHPATPTNGFDGQVPAPGGMQRRPDIAEPPSALTAPSSNVSPAPLKVSLLTGGGDRHYALGLASALMSQGIAIDFIGSDELDAPELHNNPQAHFLNLRGSTRPDASALQKTVRILAYYRRLIRYVVTAEPGIFHILWNNKFELFDRTLLMLYYKLLGRKIVFTAHNVNAGERDANDSLLNRLSLKIQYRLCDHILVHTEKMKRELNDGFGVAEASVSVIPYGINNKVPDTGLTTQAAKERLGLGRNDKAVLFFGSIVPYKGLEFALRALATLSSRKDLRLLIAGKPKGDGAYWKSIQQEILTGGLSGSVSVRSEFIPDEDTELYFKAADVLVLPYTHIFQSGVLFLSYSFGLPVIAADVGSLKEEIVEGKTGFVFRPRDAADLADVIEKYFASDLYRNLEIQRQAVRDYGNERHSWTKVGGIIKKVYSRLMES